MVEPIKNAFRTSGWEVVIVVAVVVFIFIVVNLLRISVSKNNSISKLKKGSYKSFIIFLSLILFYLLNILVVVRHFSMYFKGEEYKDLILLNEIISGICFGFLFFSGVIFLLQDIFILIFFLIRKIVNLINKNATLKIFLKIRKVILSPFVVIGLSIIVSCLSLIAPNNITETRYLTTIKKSNNNISDLKICFISDFHLGVSIKKNQLNEIAGKIKEEDPDILILGGDIFDEGTSYQEKIDFAEVFREIEPKFGKFFIEGNHDEYKERHAIRDAYKKGEITKEELIYSLKNTDAALPFMNRAGIISLVDNYRIVENAFIIYGLDDYNNFETKHSDKSIVKKINDANDVYLPVILVSHQPKCGVIRKSLKAPYLQLSGHTHNGQILPLNFLNLIDNSSYQYGFYEKERVIVSSGVGTYGVPLRFLTKSELLFINVKFE